MKSFARRQRDFPPHLAGVSRRAARPLPHGLEQGARLGTLGPREAIEVLQRQKRLHRVLGARAEIIGELLPAPPDVDAGDLEAREQ